MLAGNAQAIKATANIRLIMTSFPAACLVCGSCANRPHRLVSVLPSFTSRGGAE